LRSDLFKYNLGKLDQGFLNYVFIFTDEVQKPTKHFDCWDVKNTMNKIKTLTFSFRRNAVLRMRAKQGWIGKVEVAAETSKPEKS
jgi:hypothetical protein